MTEGNPSRMSRKITRRKLALALAGSGAASALAGRPQGPTPPRNALDDLETARRRVKATGALLAKYEVPMSTEPAFQFKA